MNTIQENRIDQPPDLKEVEQFFGLPRPGASFRSICMASTEVVMNIQEV